MTHKPLIHTLAIIAALILTAPIASAACDISGTKCALNGGKCNIKFRNRTGDSGGSDGSSIINQTSSAQTITVKAVDGNGNKKGNKLDILADASKTMNIEKKANKGFDSIKIASKSFGAVRSATMSCKDVQNVLNGNGTCKIFYGIKEKSDNRKYKRQLGYQCDGGNVGGPSND